MQEQDNAIKVLILEDNADDVELELHQLRKAGLFFTHAVARNRKEFIDEIDVNTPDIILADYSLPDLTGIEAIGICREHGLDLPVILITGEGNEMIAVDSLRQGAVDYLLKHNISGLGPRVVRALEICNDRRAKQRAEEEERRLQEVLSETQKMEAIGRLAGGIAHDFNNILTGVMGFAEICLKDVPPGSASNAMLHSIINVSQKGADLVKQLLIFSRKVRTEFVRVDMNQFLTETIGFLRRILEETIEIRLELSEGLPPVLCDKAQFTQMMMNLLLNARDALHGNGVITVRSGFCQTGERFGDREIGEIDRHVCISVSDTGIGIAEETLPHIFEPFFTTKDFGKGTGLGLSIVYSVVQAHHGLIRVDSIKGHGSTFRIALPAAPAQEEPEDSPFYDMLPPHVIDAIGGTETVLVAEDDEIIRNLLADFLRIHGYEIVTAVDGEQAMAVFRDDPHKFDIIISDMRMPNRGGIELFQGVRLISGTVPFILMTGHSLSEIDDELLKQMQAVLIKPFIPAKAAKTIRSVLDADRL